MNNTLTTKPIGEASLTVRDGASSTGEGTWVVELKGRAQLIADDLIVRVKVFRDHSAKDVIRKYLMFYFRDRISV